MAENFDLLGDPIPEGHGKRGRPTHIATTENRNKVILLQALGWTNPRIANALGITPPTLRKNYFRELKVREASRDRLDAARFNLLWSLAKGGNVGAIKELGRVIEKSDALMGERSFLKSQQPAPEAKPKLGKKELAQLEAETAGQGSEWENDLKQLRMGMN